MLGQKVKNRVIALVTLGSFLEWAEFSFYAYMVNTIARLFFPTNLDQKLATINAFALFSISYLIRPIGAIAFGHLGDKYGRKPALILSMLLMSAATLCIGLLPTYNQIGILAPCLLLLLRILQSLSLSGEYNGAAI